jgi:hypothetical protein
MRPPIPHAPGHFSTGLDNAPLGRQPPSWREPDNDLLAGGGWRPGASRRMRVGPEKPALHTVDLVMSSASELRRAAHRPEGMICPGSHDALAYEDKSDFLHFGRCRKRT